MTSASDSRWEKFAQANAEHYVWTDHRDYGDPKAMESFLASGRREVDEIMEVAGDDVPRRGTALEIGCGVGRLTIPMAERFDKVVALDVSPTMLRRLAEYCELRGVRNVVPLLSTDFVPSELNVDLVFSRLVFQHLESLEEISDYVTGAARSLSEGGRAYLQFDTRPPDLAYRAKSLAPDWALPPRWRRGIRRIRRSPAELRELFDRAGLDVVAEFRPDSDLHAFVLTPRLG